jgi:hypothetical protein
LYAAGTGFNLVNLEGGLCDDDDDEEEEEEEEEEEGRGEE